MTRSSLCRKAALGALLATKNTKWAPETSFRSPQARGTALQTLEKPNCGRSTSTRIRNLSRTGLRKSDRELIRCLLGPGVFQLGAAWYGHHLDEDWHKWTLDEARA